MEPSITDQKLMFQIPTSSLSVLPNFPDVVSSFLLFLAAGPGFNEGLFTNISFEPTWRWYFAMTPFESMFLAMIIMQFAVLNLFGIFPMNLSNFIHGMVGRKKRDTFEVSQTKKYISSQLLKLLKKLDPDQCSFKALCELEIKSCVDGSSQIPKGINTMLSLLKLSAKKRKKEETELSFFKAYKQTQSTSSSSLSASEEDDVLPLYEEAVVIGHEMPFHQNVSLCETRYPHCPINREEIIDYVKKINIFDDMF